VTEIMYISKIHIKRDPLFMLVAAASHHATNKAAHLQTFSNLLNSLDPSRNNMK